MWLSSGGTLVIDPCEAMTVIDVNTAKFTGKRELEDTVLRLNLEACGEIARQVRLRNLSGIIIIDMIDMKTPEHRQMVLDALEEAFASDRVKTVIHGLTSLGLVEMTRNGHVRRCGKCLQNRRKPMSDRKPVIISEEQLEEQRQYIQQIRLMPDAPRATTL